MAWRSSLLRLVALTLFVRFAVPGIALLNHVTYEAFLADHFDDSYAALESAKDDFEAAEATEQVVNLIVVFVLTRNAPAFLPRRSPPPGGVQQDQHHLPWHDCANFALSCAERSDYLHALRRFVIRDTPAERPNRQVLST
jgi:hypothetical protein